MELIENREYTRMTHDEFRYVASLFYVLKPRGWDHTFAEYVLKRCPMDEHICVRTDYLHRYLKLWILVDYSLDSAHNVIEDLRQCVGEPYESII